MRFFNSIVISASAFAALVSADISFTDAPHGSAEAGQTYTLKWTGDTNVPATILLRKGPSNALQTVSTITTGATGGSFSWTIPKDIASAGDYALQITAGTDTNYWQVGAIAGGTGAATTSNSASSAASSASSSVSSSASSALSSASSQISSLSSKLSSVTASSGTATATSKGNSTSVTRATLTSTSATGSTTGGASSTSSSSTSTTSAPSGDGMNLKSNLALVLGAVAAVAYLG